MKKLLFIVSYFFCLCGKPSGKLTLNPFENKFFKSQEEVFPFITTKKVLCYNKTIEQINFFERNDIKECLDFYSDDCKVLFPLGYLDCQNHCDVVVIGASSMKNAHRIVHKHTIMRFRGF